MAVKIIWLSNGIISILSQTENPSHNQDHMMPDLPRLCSDHLCLPHFCFCLYHVYAVLFCVSCSSTAQTSICYSSTISPRLLTKNTEKILV
jgi:hypothetical protein